MSVGKIKTTAYDFPTLFDHMAGLQQIFARHSYIVILIRAFVAYIPQRRILGIRGPGKRK